MVAPLRETPGIKAKACPSPNKTAFFVLMSVSLFVCLAYRSANPRRIPITINVAATSQRFLAVVSIDDLNASPAIPIGIVPMITYQPIFASGLARSLFLVRLANQAFRIRAISCRK